MFWECHVVSSSIDKLLDQPAESMKLQDLLDESDLIQECLTQNKRLIDYLVQPHIMNELIGHIIKYPSDENFRNAHVVSELLSGDFQRIQEALLEKEQLDQLYSFLLSHEPLTLNPILASYFSRIFMTLIIRRSSQLLDYLKSRPTFRDDCLRHLDSTSITDVLYRLIADSAEQRPEAIKWYEEIQLIDGLVEQLITASSPYVQMNAVNLLSEFLRLAFDSHSGMDSDSQGAIGAHFSMPMAQRSFNERNEDERDFSSSSPNSSKNDSEDQSAADKVTPLRLAQRILSKSNLERLLDALGKTPTLVSNGCDFLNTVCDLLSRYMPAPTCIPIISTPKDDSSSSDKEENEHMQVDDDGDSPSANKFNGKSFDEKSTNVVTTLTANAKDPLMQMYLTLLDVIPSRLPSLISLLSKPSPPLIPPSLSSSPTHDSSQTVKYQFISEPLGTMRLNLIKFFSKLMHTIANDHTGDQIYQILNTHSLLTLLIDLFYNHIYNNFLHTQVSLVVRLLFQINSQAIKQPNEIWTRTPLDQPAASPTSELPISSSPFYYTNRCSYKLFQSLLTPSEVNLIERLLDQYELNVASSKSILTSTSSDDAISSSILHARFATPNSGHVAQILRCLREYAGTFNNYSSFFKTDEQQQIDEQTNMLEIRWQTALDYLIEDEKKWSAMHHQERETSSNFRMASAASIMAHFNNANSGNDSGEAGQRRHTFHMRSFGSSGAPYMDDDDEDEAERFDIDDDVMSNEQTSGERKVADMKKISFDPQFPPVFEEQSLWHQNDDDEVMKDYDGSENHEKTKATLPDLFANHHMAHDSSGASTESNFEQLCSMRGNDHGGGPVTSSVKAGRGETDEGQDEF